MVYCMGDTKRNNIKCKKGRYFMVLYPRKFRGPHITFPGIGTHSYTVSSSWEECSASSAAIAMLQIFPFIVPPGTHYCWVDRGIVWDARFLPNFTFARVSSRGCYQAAPRVLRSSGAICEHPRNY